MKDDPDTWLKKQVENNPASLRKRIATLRKSRLEVKNSFSSNNPTLLLSTRRYEGKQYTAPTSKVTLE